MKEVALVEEQHDRAGDQRTDRGHEQQARDHDHPDHDRRVERLHEPGGRHPEVVADQDEGLEPPANEFDPEEWVRLKGARTLQPAERRVLRELFVLRDHVPVGFKGILIAALLASFIVG